MTRDQELIVTLLCGNAMHDDSDPPQYLAEGSAEEKEARRALARMLRTSLPLDQGVRGILADLIDPDRDELNRRIRFEHRRKGKPSNAAAEKKAAEFIWAQRRAGVKMKSVITAAMKQFGLKEKRVLAIWKHWRPILEHLKRIDLGGKPTNPFAAVQHNTE